VLKSASVVFFVIGVQFLASDSI